MSRIPSATSLPLAPRLDMNTRMRRYLLSMAIRTICFVAAYLLEGPGRWVAVIGAVVLPYVAVVLANATNKRRIDTLGSVSPDTFSAPRLESAPTAAA